jgi:hypothetical protein
MTERNSSIPNYNLHNLDDWNICDDFTKIHMMNIKQQKTCLEISYIRCLKEYYMKNAILENNCDTFVKKYESIHQMGKNP